MSQMVTPCNFAKEAHGHMVHPEGAELIRRWIENGAE
jgi:hypothetical protein